MSVTAKIWSSTLCVDLLKGQNVIEIDSEESVEKGCEILVEHGISSAPVYNKKINSYVGMFDYRDVVAFVLVAFRRKSLDPIQEENNNGAHNVEIDHIVRCAMTGGHTKTGLVAGRQGIN
jgi:CBS domain-containing protein